MTDAGSKQVKPPSPCMSDLFGPAVLQDNERTLAAFLRLSSSELQTSKLG